MRKETGIQICPILQSAMLPTYVEITTKFKSELLHALDGFNMIAHIVLKCASAAATITSGIVHHTASTDARNLYASRNTENATSFGPLSIAAACA